MSESRPMPRPPNPPDRSTGTQINPGGSYAEELAKFEQWPTAWAPRPGNPYQYRPFPKMVYKAGDWMGRLAAHAVPGPSWEFRDMEEYRRAEESATLFTRSCERIVKNEQELQKAHEEGYRGDPVEAVKYLEDKKKAVSTAAAERHTTDKLMSEPAQREAAAADAATAEHLGAIPEKPVTRKRGRPKGSKNKAKR